MPMKNDAKERLIKERDELKERFSKLDKFIQSEEFQSLKLISRTLLIEQEKAMGTYLNILDCRIELEDFEREVEVTCDISRSEVNNG